MELFSVINPCESLQHLADVATLMEPAEWLKEKKNKDCKPQLAPTAQYS
jgi:hypothetical protein